MVKIDLKQFFMDHSIFGFFWCRGMYRGTGTKGGGKYGIYTKSNGDSYKLNWRWTWHTDLEKDWNCTVWHRCYKRNARTAFKWQ